MSVNQDAIPHLDIMQRHLRSFLKPEDFTFYSIKYDDNTDFHTFWIKPHPGFDFNLLLTCGLSSFPLKTPEKMPHLPNRVEFAIKMPKDWQPDFNSIEGYWPIEEMRFLAFYLMEKRESVFVGRSFSCVTPDEEIKPHPFDALVVMPFKTFTEAFYKINTPNNSLLIYCLLPLFKDELDFKNNYTMNQFFEKLNEADIEETVEIDRPSFMAL